MALIKHKYSDSVVDALWKLKNSKSGDISGLVISGVQIGKGDFAIRVVEEDKVMRDKGEVVIVDNRMLNSIFLSKFGIYTKEQSKQFFYRAVNTLMDRQATAV